VVKGKIEWISGPAVKASGMAASKMHEVVEDATFRTSSEISWVRLQGQIRKL